VFVRTHRRKKKTHTVVQLPMSQHASYEILMQV